MDKLNNLPYLKERRRELRNNGTVAEASLWQMLKNKQLAGRKFRRQHSFGNYILDFYCAPEKLAVELDGADHFTETGQENDLRRDAFLAECGIKVLRFENEEVFKAPEAVLAEISRHFK